jgi:hypothetical protein
MALVEEMRAHAGVTVCAFPLLIAVRMLQRYVLMTSSNRAIHAWTLVEETSDCAGAIICVPSTETAAMM